MTETGQISFEDRMCDRGCGAITSHRITEKLSPDGDEWLMDAECLTPENHEPGGAAPRSS